MEIASKINDSLVRMSDRIDKMSQAYVELSKIAKPQQEKRYFCHAHASDATDQIDAAHSLSLAELKNVSRQATANRSMYAKVEHCIEAINPVLSKFELSIKQLISYNEYGEDILITRLSHKSGQWYESVAFLKIDKTNAQTLNQQLGTSLTYMRRYALLSIVGIGQIDDSNDTDR